MRELTNVRLRTLIWLILPVTVLVVIPSLLCRASHQSLAWRGDAWQWVGAWLIANGLALSAWCVNLFNVEGRGTPLPLDPPTRFVASGPYRFVRNPMMLGAFLILGGEAALARSGTLVAYLAAGMFLVHLFVRFWEEPDLRRRFGAAYEAYARQVPRWIPRTIPWRQR